MTSSTVLLLLAYLIVTFAGAQMPVIADVSADHPLPGQTYSVNLVIYHYMLTEQHLFEIV